MGKAIALELASEGANVLITYASSEIQARKCIEKLFEKYSVGTLRSMHLAPITPRRQQSCLSPFKSENNRLHRQQCSDWQRLLLS